MGKLINIDNGGTLTDICVIDGPKVYRTKTVTTPYDLSKCFFDGLRKVSQTIYGEDDLQALLSTTDHIRYSTTHGTNALVERKGPRLGLILGGTLEEKSLQADDRARDVFASLVGERVARIDRKLKGEALEAAAVQAVSRLAAAGANRLVVAFGGAQRLADEKSLARILLRKFPPQLLGAIPILYSHEVVADEDDPRRAWTALLNAFLHPAMERFLYASEHKLRAHKMQNPLLVFRNDGHSARVAKTIAMKTYSSGPRGGMEGSRVLARHYGFKHLLTMDIGGTTTDIGLVDKGEVHTARRGTAEGVAISFPLCEVTSIGVGGSSIIKSAGGKALKVGPESVGGAPGPACFGFGGKEATITDAFLVQGLLDPASYFGGELKIDAERAKAAVLANVGKPLGLDAEGAAAEMEKAWVAKVADNLKSFTPIKPDTTLAAFGGAGPLVVCRIADAAGIGRVVIPGLAAVFSAFGLGFSDIAHTYETALGGSDAESVRQAAAGLETQAARGMFAEGFALDACTLTRAVSFASGRKEQELPMKNGRLPAGVPAKAALTLSLSATKSLPQPKLTGSFGGRRKAATTSGTRRILHDGQWHDVPVYRVDQQSTGASAVGPAVLEEAFYTCRIEPGWRFEINAARDVLLSRV